MKSTEYLVELRLSEPGRFISGGRRKELYADYQLAYRKEFGVFPELDKKNRPMIANISDVYDVYRMIRRKGFYGAWFWHDLHCRFNNKFKPIYERYKQEWSFFALFSTDHADIARKILMMEPCEEIHQGLGYKKLENGDYFEGTWEDGRLVYGLAYYAQHNTWFVGRFEYRMTDTMEGVAQRTVEGNKTNTVTSILGKFYFKKEIFRIHSGDAFTCVSRVRDGEILGMDVSVGGYIDGYEHGHHYTKSFNDGIKVGYGKYKDGDFKSSIGPWGWIWRTYTALTWMLMYYMIKYTYGLPIVLIVNAYKKKHWK